MADRKLLILTYHFPPSAASGTFRMLGFAQRLPQFGWQTVVVAPPRLPWEPTDEALLRRVPPETIVYRSSYPTHPFWKPLRKILPWGVWLPFAAAGCYRAIRDHRPDSVLTSGPPHHIHLLGRHLHRSLGLPWVADFRDPWVAGDPSTSSTKTAPKAWEIRAEPAVMRDADAIVVNTPGARDLLAKAYPQHVLKMMSITNGYDPDNFEVNPVPPMAGQTVQIVHPGTIYANRDPGPFLEAVRQLPTGALFGKSLSVRFMGDFVTGSQKVEIEEQIRAGGLEGVVTIDGQVPHAQSLRAMTQADILLLLDSPGRRAGIPAKLYEYIGAGRPILALADFGSDVAWVLTESGLPHRIAPPGDPAAIRRALLELIQDPATTACGAAPRKCPIRFTRAHIAGELARLLDSCLNGRSRTSALASKLEAAR